MFLNQKDKDYLFFWNNWGTVKLLFYHKWNFKNVYITVLAACVLKKINSLIKTVLAK